MTDQILTTKLCLPILRNDIILRGRLNERLKTGLWQPEGFVRKLTLVSAPAGFGKTTLVSEWLSMKENATSVIAFSSPPFQAAWLSLDESDNDPARFLAYFIAALSQIQAGFGERTQSILKLPQPPPPEIILTSLVNEISGLSGLFILALDDYHVIHSLQIHQQLAFILDHLPANLHLVILTRDDPLLPVARLRARGQLLELRQDDLRFQSEEIAEFLHRKTGQSLGKENIEALEQRTEGWVAGLQLAAISMAGREDWTAFVRDFMASDRYILDYLVEEVFERQPGAVQDFLLQTSILTRLTGPLCDAVTGRSNSRDVLRHLEQSNLFIVPLDPHRTWYRYHRLFGELLQHRMRLSDFSDANLHQRASQWYEAQGLFQEAVEHAFAAQDWGNAARLVGMASEGMFNRGEVVTLLGWYGSLPKEIINASPDLGLAYTWAALMASQFEIAAPVLERVEQMAPVGTPLAGRVAAAQAFLARSKRDNALAIEKSEQALALLPVTEVAMRGNIAMNLGLAYWHEGRMAEAQPVLVQASSLCEMSGNYFALLTTQIFLARIPAVQGKLCQAAAMLEKLIQAGGQVPVLCLAHYDLAAIYYEWNDLPKALEHFEQGFLLAQRSGNVEFQQAGHLQRAILAWAQGNESSALSALADADNLAHDFPVAVQSRTAALGVCLALLCNDLPMVAFWSERVKAEVDFHSFYRFMGLTRARLLLAQGKQMEAGETLAALYAAAAGAGWGYGMLVVRILQSLAARTTVDALHFVADALHFGQLEGYLRSFVDVGRSIIPILQEAAVHGIEPAYVGQILFALGAEHRAISSQAIPEQASLVEPLSEREIEVLRLVTAGLSNREIAEKLFISPGTAKTHIHHLCGKLGVRNRTEAAMKAQKLHLV